MRKPSYRTLGRAAQNDADKLVPLMRAAEPTAFSLEAAAVFALRSIRCLSGWTFDAADITARDITRVALNLCGAVRPSWDDGQPVPQPLMAVRTCVTCGGPLYGFREEFHCSRACQVKSWNTRLGDAVADRRAQVREALRCIICKTPIKSSRADAKFCGHRCRQIAQDAAGKDYDCLWCNKTFRRYAQPGRPAPRFCCHSCQQHWRWANRGEGPRGVRAASAEARDVLPARAAAAADAGP